MDGSEVQRQQPLRDREHGLVLRRGLVEEELQEVVLCVAVLSTRARGGALLDPTGVYATHRLVIPVFTQFC